MDPLEYLRTIRRRWTIIVVTLALALAAAWTTVTVVPVASPTSTYQASVVVLNTGPINVPGIAGLGTVASLVTVGEVPVRVAEELGYEGSPADLAAQVTATADETGLLRITALAKDPEEAKILADTFAEQLLAFLDVRKAETIAQQTRFLRERMEELEAETAALDARIIRAPPGEAEFLTQTRNAKIQVFAVLSEQLNSLVLAAATPGTLLIMEKASPREISSPGFQAPQSRSGRMILAGIIGLFLGAAIALVADRVDTRIRTKKEAEDNFRLPVLSEIPAVRRGQLANGQVVTWSQPTSPAADAFRLLAASVGRPPNPDGTGQSAASVLGSPSGRSRSILVTSAVPREGKSSVVANLAAAFSQMGKRVLVLSCDFRHPAVHGMLGVENGEGLANLLRKKMNGHSILEGHLQDTPLPGVQLVPSGPPPPRPSSLLTTAGMRRALDEARHLADVVLLDTPAILQASDAAHLVEQVDSVLVVARAGSVTVEQAGRTSDLLERLNADVAGVALNGTSGVVVEQRGWRRVLAGLRGFPELFGHLRRR